MANKQYVWPVGQEAKRDAYADFADAQYALLTGVPGDIFTYRREDAYGQPYCAYLGPPFVLLGNVVQPPEGSEALLADGVLVDAVVLPPEEE